MRKKLQLALIALLVSIGAKAQLASNPDKFLGNITTSGQVDFGAESFYTLWNQITCENETKWESVEGNNNSFNWGGADRAYNYAKNHNFPFKFHALIWGSQYPKWLESMTPQQRYNEIVQWMDKVKERYPDLKLIDVVNEAVSGHQAGTQYFIEALGGTGVTGYDWIIKAFELAYERWPNAILIYNDFNTFQWNTDQYISLVKALRDGGAPVDAYGCQSHDLTNCSLSTFKNSMTKLQNALKMPMYSTEYDIGTTNDNLQLQRYKEQIPYMWEQDYCAGITLWGYIYGRTWTNDGKDENGNTINAGHSGIIKDGVDRPAMTWLREYMQTDAAKNAKSPFPGMVKEASVYIKPECVNVEKGNETKVTIRAKMLTKTIEKVDFYVKGNLVSTMTEAPYVTAFTPTTTGAHELKAVVTCTDGTTYERYGGVTAFNPRAPYNNTPTELPGVLQAENFDSGAEGIAYHDTNSAKEGTGASYRSDPTGVDIEKGGSGYVLGYTQVGEWVEYTVNVKKAGLYAVNINYSAPEEGASYNLSLKTPDGLVSLTQKDVVVPSTSSWSTFTTAYTRTLVPLEEGVQTIRLTITGGPNYVINIDKFTFEQINVDEDIDIELANDDEDYMTDTEATFTANVSASSEIQNVKFYINGLLKKTITDTPYDYVFKTATVGQYDIMAYATTVDGTVSKTVSKRLNVIPKQGPYNGIKLLPGTIEAEDFDLGGEGLSFHESDTRDEGKANYRSDNEGVDIKKIADGGYAIGYTADGEWLNYTVNVTTAGKYKCEVVASSAVDGSKVQVGFVEKNDVAFMRTISIPNTGSGVFNTVVCKSTKTLTEGKHVVQLYFPVGGCEIDKIIFKLDGVDDIEEVSLDESSEGPAYSITGQRVGENYKGVVIKNGKKVLVR